MLNICVLHAYRLNQVTKKIEPYMRRAVRIRKTLISFSVVVLLLTLACCIALGMCECDHGYYDFF